MRTQPDEIFRLRMPTEVHCAPGALGDVAPRLAGLDTSRVTAVVDRNVASLPVIRGLLDQLDASGALQVLDGPAGEPDFAGLEALRAEARRAGPSLLFGVGGGSTMDAAKGLAIVLTNDGPCDRYQGMELYDNPGVPCVTVPTLFGSGAEVTPSAVFINRASNRKGGINGRHVFPRLALIDPMILDAAPKSLIATTAMDAMVHGIEAAVARCATPISRMFSIDAAGALFRALARMDGEGPDETAFALLAEGALKAIIGLMHSEQGLAGAASYPMGAFHDVPHAVAGGRCLPHAVMLNGSHMPHLWDDLAQRVLGWRPQEAESSAEAIAGRLLELLARYDVPRLSRWLSDADLPALAKEVQAFRGVMEQNPVDLSVSQIRAFLEGILADENARAVRN